MSEIDKTKAWKTITEDNGLKLLGRILLALAIGVFFILLIVSTCGRVPEYKFQLWSTIAASILALSVPFCITGSIVHRQNILIQQNNRIIELLENKEEKDSQE